MAKRKNLDSRFGDFANNVTRKFRSRSQYEFSTPQLGEYQFAKNGLYQKKNAKFVIMWKKAKNP